jgi:hypothetical protein
LVILNILSLGQNVKLPLADAYTIFEWTDAEKIYILINLLFLVIKSEGEYNE